MGQGDVGDFDSGKLRKRLGTAVLLGRLGRTRQKRIPMKKSNFYYVTTPEAAHSILKDGLKANEEGHIFVIIDKRFADCIAKTQIFLPRYALLGIDSKGIKGCIERDGVGEYIAPVHRIIFQPVIKPRWLTLIEADTETS